MTDSLFEAVAHATRELTKYGFSTQEFAMLVQQHNMTDAEALAVAKVFDYLLEKREHSTVDFLLRTSHLPLKVPKTFDNFDFSRVTGKNVDKLRSLPTLSALYAHKNLAFIGRPGTGKTHLAQAFGRTCCEHGFRSYFIKMTELRDRMTSARRSGRESNLLSYLVRPSCLIIDEVGHCEFDKENTRLFFDMVDRRYQKEGYSNMVFTSNRDPAQWNERLVDHILKGIRLCGIGRALDGDRPLVVGAGGGTPGAVFLLHIHSHTTVHADAVVTACLSGSRQEDIAQRLHRALPHHAVGRNAVDAVRPLPGVVWAEFRIRYQ